MKFKEGDIVVLTDNCESYFGPRYGDYGQKYELLRIRDSIEPKRGWNDMLVDLRNVKTGKEFEIHMTWIDDLKYHRDRQIRKII